MKKMWLYIVFLLFFSSAISQAKSIEFSHERNIYRTKAGGSIKSIPKNVIKNTEEFVKSATKSDRNGLSKLGRGLQKHSSRKGSAFKDVKFSHKNADQIGEKILRNILNSKDKTIQKLPNGTTNIFDKNTGRGVNISREGLFNGFRDQF